MPERTSGEAVPSTKGERKPFDAKRSWFVFKYLNAASAEDPMASYIAGAERAYKDAVLDQIDFVGLTPMMRRLLELLEAWGIERDIVRAVMSGEVDV